VELPGDVPASGDAHRRAYLHHRVVDRPDGMSEKERDENHGRVLEAVAEADFRLELSGSPANLV
jgi:hypothetical protein